MVKLWIESEYEYIYTHLVQHSNGVEASFLCDKTIITVVHLTYLIIQF